MWLQKAFDGDSEDDDEDEEEDELARLLRKTHVGYDFSMGAVGVATVIGVDRGPSPRGGGARIVTIGLQSNVPLGTAILKTRRDHQGRGRARGVRVAFFSVHECSL